MADPKNDAGTATAIPEAPEPTCHAEEARGNGVTVRCVLARNHGGGRHQGADGSTWLARSKLYRRWGRR